MTKREDLDYDWPHEGPPDEVIHAVANTARQGPHVLSVQVHLAAPTPRLSLLVHLGDVLATVGHERVEVQAHPAFEVDTGTNLTRL